MSKLRKLPAFLTGVLSKLRKLPASPKGHRGFPLLLLLCFVFLISSLSFAGEYVLVEGREFEVCRAYSNNLNSFKDLRYPMVCERLINPDFKDFSKPKWTPIDVWSKRELARQFHKLLFYRNSIPPWNEPPEVFYPKLKEWIAEGRIRMSEAHLDINNDGTIDHVIRYDYGHCDPSLPMYASLPTGRAYMALDDKTGQIDEWLTQFLLHHLDVFLYKGRVYTDWFAGKRGSKGGQLWVYDSTFQGALLANRCTYDYKEGPEKP